VLSAMEDEKLFGFLLENRTVDGWISQKWYLAMACQSETDLEEDSSGTGTCSTSQDS